MKLFTRFLAVALACVFMLSFAACGGDPEQATTTTAAASTAIESTNSVTQTGTNSVTKVTATTSGGKKDVTITNNSKYPAIDAMIKRTKNAKNQPTDAFIKSLKGYKLNIMQAWEPSKKGTVHDSNMWCEKQVEDLYGVTINVNGVFLQYNEMLTAKLAARKAEAQIYMVQDFNFASYFKNNYLADLTSGMNKAGVDFKDPWYNQTARNFLNINYKQYGWIAYGVEYTFPYGIMYNKDMMDKKKLTDPAQLVSKGKWTWSTLESYAKKLNSNSVIGFGCANTSLMLASMSSTMSVPIVNVKKGAMPATNISNQTVKECLTQIGKWCKTGGICNTFSGLDWTAPKTKFSAGKVAMLYCSHDAIKNTVSNSSFDSEIGFVPFPTKTETKKFKSISIPQFVWFVPSQYQTDVAKILFIRNELYRREYMFAARNFQIQWEQYFESDSMIDLVCNLMYGKGNFSTMYDWRSVCEQSGAKYSTNTVVSYVINGGSVQTAIDKYKASLENCYKDMWTGYKITGNV